MTEPGPVLQARGVVVERRRRTILGGVDLDLPAGHITGLVGPNGAGKTTLLSVVAGLLRPRRGEVRLAGEVLKPRHGLATRARRGLGYLPQVSSTFARLTVWENLRSVPAASREACEAMAERVGLTALLSARAGNLSGGERRRLELGRLFLLEPLVVLLCDEPFAGLDPLGVAAVSRLLREAADEGRAVLVTDHRIEALFELCDSLYVLLDGQMAAHGDVATVTADPHVRARYLGASRAPAPDQAE